MIDGRLLWCPSVSQARGKKTPLSVAESTFAVSITTVCVIAAWLKTLP